MVKNDSKIDKLLPLSPTAMPMSLEIKNSVPTRALNNDNWGGVDQTSADDDRVVVVNRSAVLRWQWQGQLLGVLCFLSWLFAPPEIKRSSVLS